MHRVVAVIKPIKLTTAMKMAVSRVVAWCSLVEVYQHFRGTCWLHNTYHPDDGDSKYL
jgi:hypothetical protein